ncbi:CHAT domain containing protein [Lactarius tabidus]
MQLCPELANHGSWDVPTRFEISWFWASLARVNMHPSVPRAYETAMSLLQETLVFCPTLQTQHRWRLPSDYASYQIGNGQVEQAIETLERGRSLIWSEMRGLRTSTNQLRAADTALADKFADINQRLESVMMSVAPSDDNQIGRSETGTGRREHSIGHLVISQRRLLEERNTLLSHIRSLPGFEHFLKVPSFDALNSAASHGPVVIINQSQIDFPSQIIILLKDSPPSIISTPSSFDDRANQLEDELLHVRKGKGLDSKDYDLKLASVLSNLYELVGKAVIKRLRELKVPEKSRVWWCPTGAFCSLPLHAMGPIPSDDGYKRYFLDLYIPSYIQSLSALIESRKRVSLSDASDNVRPSILLVAQPDTLPGAFGEIMVIQTTKAPVTTLISAMATPEKVIAGLRDHRFVHFVCHGVLETGKPFDASFELHKANLTLLAIVRSQLPAAEFAFLAACHTAELTEGSVSDEGLHLAAAMQHCGFRSVVGTMWAMADTDGADLSRHFYKTIFAEKASQDGVPYHERSARALQIAVKKLRKKRGITLERWVNFVHYGA